MTIRTDPPDAETAARASLAGIRRVLAEDRASFAARTGHEGVIALSSGRPVPAGPPPPSPLPVNTHPGPDFYPEPEAA